MNTSIIISALHSPFMALALYLGYPIWSNDDHFKQQNIVKTYTTEELMKLLREKEENEY